MLSSGKRENDKLSMSVWPFKTFLKLCFQKKKKKNVYSPFRAGFYASRDLRHWRVREALNNHGFTVQLTNFTWFWDLKRSRSSKKCVHLVYLASENVPGKCFLHKIWHRRHLRLIFRDQRWTGQTWFWSLKAHVRAQASTVKDLDVPMHS